LPSHHTIKCYSTSLHDALPIFGQATGCSAIAIRLHNQDCAPNNRSLIGDATAAPGRERRRRNINVRPVEARLQLQLVGSNCALAVAGTGHRTPAHQPTKTVLADEEVT